MTSHTFIIRHSGLITDNFKNTNKILKAKVTGSQKFCNYFYISLFCEENNIRMVWFKIMLGLRSCFVAGVVRLRSLTF